MPRATAPARRVARQHRDGEQPAHPDIAALADGGFVIVWESWFQSPDGSYKDIFAQRFDASGAGGGGMNSPSTPYKYLVPSPTPRSTATPDGGFIVAWSSL